MGSATSFYSSATLTSWLKKAFSHSQTISSMPEEQHLMAHPTSACRLLSTPSRRERISGKLTLKSYCTRKQTRCQRRAQSSDRWIRGASRPPTHQRNQRQQQTHSQPSNDLSRCPTPTQVLLDTDIGIKNKHFQLHHFCRTKLKYRRKKIAKLLNHLLTNYIN